MNKRTLPRHVDGRIKIGLMPLSKFFIFLPIAVVIIAVVVMNFSEITFLIGFFIIGLIGILFSEFQQKETGFDVLRDMIAFMIIGDQYFERGVISGANKRFTRNQIKK